MDCQSHSLHEPPLKRLVGLSLCSELESGLEDFVLLDLFSAWRGLATRKRVYILSEGHLFERLILVKLMANVFLYCSFIRPYRIHKVPSAPKVTVPGFVLQVRVAVKYHQGTFPLQMPLSLLRLLVDFGV